MSGKWSIKRIISLLMALILVSTFMPFAAFANDYADHWAADSINLLIARGVVEGYSDGSIKPNDNITRAEFVSIINKAFGYTEQDPSNFPDVGPGKWYYNQFAVAKKAGYITGDASGNANPEVPINRAEVVVILDRVLGLPQASASSSFADSGSFPAWSVESINKLVEAKLVQGYNDNTFRALNNISRAEAFTIIARLFTQDLIPGDEIGEEDVPLTPDPILSPTPAPSGGGGGGSGGGGGTTTPSNVLVTGIGVADPFVNIGIGMTAQINATVTPDNATNKTLSYVSSNPKAATVLGDMITGVGAGSAEILVSSTDGSNRTAKVTVQVSSVLVEAIEPNPLTIGLAEGETSQIGITFTPENATNKGLTYFSSRSDIVTVSPTGRITGIKQGTAEIEVTTADGSNITTIVNVVVGPVIATGIDFPDAGTEITLMMGDTMQIGASVKPSNASVKDLKYSSSDEYAAIVSNTGLVTALAQGNTTITVETADGSGLKKEINLYVDVDRSNMPKILLTSDGEVDDQNSIIHFLLYLNEVDFRGVVHGSAGVHWAGSNNYTKAPFDYGYIPEPAPYDAGKEAYRFPGWDWLEMIMDAYEEVYPNLRIHDDRYPTPNYVKDRAKIGNILYKSDMSGPTPGSILIKEEILDHVFNDKKGILTITAWGGVNSFAMGLKLIEEEYKFKQDYPEGWDWEKLQAKVREKVMLSSFGTQDDTWVWYIDPVWRIPRLIGTGSYGYNASNTGPTVAEGSRNLEIAHILGGEWMFENIDYGHGALLDHYVTWGDGYNLDYEPPRARFGDWDMAQTNHWFSSGIYSRYEFLSEGDSPTFFYHFDNGLRNWEDGYFNFNWGGWSGRVNSENILTRLNDWVVRDAVWPPDGTTFATSYNSHSRWIPQLHYDFAARADWCIATTYDSANHRPNIKINEGLDLVAIPGEKVWLSAQTSDPDGDNVTVDWWHYPEAGTNVAGTQAMYDARLIVNHETGYTNQKPVVSVTIPTDAVPGKEYHIIATVKDDGVHRLEYNQRVVITVVEPEDLDMKVYVSESVGNNNNTFYSNMGGDDKLIWTLYDTHRYGIRVGWWSTNPNVIRVINDNTKYGDTYHTAIETVSTGSATIFAITDKGFVASIDVNVKMTATAGNISVHPGYSASSIPVGSVVPLSSVATLADGGPISLIWRTDDPKVATVDQNGLMTAVGPGSCVISATTDDGGGGQAANTRAILVVRVVDELGITVPAGINPAAISTGQTAFTLAPTKTGTYTWTSSDDSVATVSSSGLVSPVGPGTVQITAASGTASRAITLVFVKMVTAITISNPGIVASNVTLTASVQPADATVQALRWTISDQSVATINRTTGALVVRKAGNVTIKVEATDGSLATATLDIEVKPVHVETVGIAVPDGIDVTDLSSGFANFTLIANVLPATAYNTSVTWVSTNMYVALVSSTGVVSSPPANIRMAGTARIVAIANDHSGVVGYIDIKVK